MTGCTADYVRPSRRGQAPSASRLYPNFYKPRAGDPPERGANVQDFGRNMIERKSIRYPIPYLTSDSSRANWTQVARADSNLSSISLSDSRSGAVAGTEQIRENATCHFETVSPCAQPLSVVYKRRDLERIPASMAFRHHHNGDDPVYFDMPPSPAAPAPSYLPGEQRHQRRYWSSVVNSPEPPRRLRSLIFHPGACSLSPLDLANGRARAHSKEEYTSYAESRAKRAHGTTAALKKEGRAHGVDRSEGTMTRLRSSSLGTQDAYLRSSFFAKDLERHRRRGSEDTGYSPPWESTSSEEQHVPLPMPFWGEFDWYPPLKVPMGRVQAFSQPLARTRVPLYESGFVGKHEVC
ncbi:hypothetical protein BESB_076590 [Besnoitia besnoiti]|uniref:Uncharacterized protein n=1 Tax=Besnoitia besnoiti TaxID=94643 RepID=A0A2A9MDJ5_BESBE|nr:hypothetical protein BESB_076590 [Besnoitia besnoiti]PFH33442.1 hypothetical protein BESB_076590 [Besnoitia besnoiti]